MKLLSTQEAAARLGISRQRVQALVAEGRLKATKIGKQWTFREADLVKFAPLPSGRPAKTERK